MLFFLGDRCCCDCRSPTVLAMLSLVGACICCPLLLICCIVGVVYCYCCCFFIIAVLVMHSHGVRFCCYCRSFAVLAMLYRVSLVLFAATKSIYYWLSWDLLRLLLSLICFVVDALSY
ncbi:hypothetical protein MAM1_0025c02070 [Mucor ambiguus]|uniref:Uncharacterized protein n=1 Tax=Mucor ambiguus TaxID=91626 RepID=A0A0C9LS90_9FUNG|nr:hypothetical protein MAM1_0025c02070 [Mucor ambiguus]